MSQNPGRCRCTQVQNRFTEIASKPELIDTEIEELRRIANSFLLIVEKVMKDGISWLHYQCPVCKIQRWLLAD